MEMPTPCPACDRIVELNDMNPCGTCLKLYCDNCLGRPFDDCDDCENLIEDEEEDAE